MPTLVRSVRKVVLFVLVMAVSGIGVAQAQTDPDIIPLSPNAVAIDGAAEGITPDIVRQSSRLYATAEQAHPATTSGGTEYMFSKTVIVSDSRIEHYTEWAFYKINGHEDRFFVDTVTVATGKAVSLDEEYRVKSIATELRHSGIARNARRIEWSPISGASLNDGPATFSLTYQGASISRTLPASPNTRVWTAPSYADAIDGPIYEHEMGIGYNGDLDDADFPEFLSGGTVSRWEGDLPWGMEIWVQGSAYSLRTGERHFWSVTQPIEE